jgi:septum formation protein
MELLGLPFIVRAPDTDEPAPEARLSPEENLERIARAKLAASGGAGDGGDDIVLAADTVVVLDGAYYGKPEDLPDAARILRRLSGRTHAVYTGVAARHRGFSEFICERTLVTFRELTEGEISEYAESRRPLDKAGAYGIQDSGFAERIDGDWYNAMGLPLGRVRSLLHNAGAARTGAAEVTG